MAVRVFFFFLGISLVFAGCKNEPYQTGPLSIATLANKESGGATLSFGYDENKLSTFSSKSASANHSMKFFYSADQLQYIKSDSGGYVATDSSGNSFMITNMYYNATVVTDSTFLFTQTNRIVDGDTVFVEYHTTFVYTRVVMYDADENPMQVKTTTWADEIQTDETVDITWENGNITRLFTTTKTGETISLKDEIALYDDKNPIYTKRKEYLYTLPTKDLFWLSGNNPVTFNDGTGEKPYSYSYNRLGYPSAYTTNVGTKYGLTYNQVAD